MSLFQPISVVCPFCDETITMEAVGSVNADRRPDLRDAILENNFQYVPCGSCGKSFRLQPEFNYLDTGNRLWIAAMPASRMPYYLDVEDDVFDLFDSSYGKKAPAAAQGVGKELDVRITFGWPAVREKLFARVNDLDDVVLELLKLDILRQMPTAPLGPGIELRLIGLLGDQMAFIWVNAQTEDAIEEFNIPREWYDSIADNSEAWAATRARLEQGPFLDMQKLYMGQGRAAARA